MKLRSVAWYTITSKIDYLIINKNCLISVLTITDVMRCDTCKGEGKGKTNSLVDIAPLTILDSGALQPRKWQLTGNDCSTAAQAIGSP